MSSPRSQELMNKNLQHEFRFTSQGISFPAAKIQLAEGWRHEMLNELNRGQVRTNILVWLSSVLHDQSRNREAVWPR